MMHCYYLWVIATALSFLQFLVFQTVDASTRHSSLVQIGAHVEAPMMLPKLLPLIPGLVGSRNSSSQPHADLIFQPLGPAPSGGVLVKVLFLMNCIHCDFMDAGIKYRVVL